MEPPAIEDALAAAETRVRDGESLSGTGFWNAISRLKGEPELVDRYADRVAVIDRAAFERWALLRVGISLGTSLMVTATIIGLALIGWAYSLQDLAAVAAFYVGFGILLVTTHGLGHLVIGRLLGIRFTHWFVGSILRPQPGVKVDYSTYLRTPARSRAWMHASGALVTKLVPFALIGAAIAADLPTWAVWGLPIIGAGSALTDVLWSTKSSDWARFKRERNFA